MQRSYLLLLTLLLALPLLAQEPVDEKANEIIRKHGLDQSQVMETASWICDIYGPRLTGSPMLDKATDWAVNQLDEWGLENVHLEEWGPFGRGWEIEDLEAETLTLENTGGTDHLAFDAVGIPGFQFIQDPVAYYARTHHSNMDNWDHLIEDDLKQAATIIASFVWHTAQRDEKLPRKPVEIEEEEAASGDRD